MELGLKDKVVLITGASRGIGLATARAFAREGARVVMAARNGEVLDAAARALREETGAQVDTFSGDLTDESNCVGLVRFARERCGRIDVLVNNASGQLPIGDFLQMTSEQWLTAWTRKLQTYVTMSREVFPIMQGQDGGRIVNVLGAHAARNPAASVLPIGVISAGLVNFIKGLADLGAQHNILVTGVSPSGVDTGPRWAEWQKRRAAAEGKPEAEMADEKVAPYALGRPARPEEIGDVVCFMASARASFISGVVLTVDGNITRGCYL